VREAIEKAIDALDACVRATQGDVLRDAAVGEVVGDTVGEAACAQRTHGATDVSAGYPPTVRGRLDPFPLGLPVQAQCGCRPGCAPT
jgi:hypothetical protein